MNEISIEILLFDLTTFLDMDPYVFPPGIWIIKGTVHNFFSNLHSRFSSVDSFYVGLMLNGAPCSEHVLVTFGKVWLPHYQKQTHTHLDMHYILHILPFYMRHIYQANSDSVESTVKF